MYFKISATVLASFVWTAKSTLCSISAQRPWHLSFPPWRLENLSFIIETYAGYPWISQLQITELPLISLGAQP